MSKPIFSHRERLWLEEGLEAERQIEKAYAHASVYSTGAHAVATLLYGTGVPQVSDWSAILRIIRDEYQLGDRSLVWDEFLETNVERTILLCP